MFTTVLSLSRDEERFVKAPRLTLLVNESDYFLSHRLNVARAAVEQGFEVHVVTRLTHRRHEIERHGVRVHHVAFPRNLRNPIVEMHTIRHLRSLYRAIQPDLVHHFSAKAVLLGSLAAHTLRLPHVINTFTGLGSAFSGTTCRDRLRRAAASCCLRRLLRPATWRVTFQNDEDMQQLIEAGLVPEERCQVIHGSGVDPSLFRPRRRVDEVPVIMMASRMIWPKGVREFVDAARLLKTTGTAAQFVLVGTSDPQNPRTVPTAQLERWNASGIIQWWGQRSDMPSTIGASSIVVLPTYYGEGLPRVLLEAAACGKPIIATDVRGCRDIVHDEANGILVPPGNIEALASAMWRLIDQPATRSRMGQFGRQLVLRRFTSAQVAQQTLAIYREMLGLPEIAAQPAPTLRQYPACTTGVATLGCDCVTASQ